MLCIVSCFTVIFLALIRFYLQNGFSWNIITDCSLVHYAAITFNKVSRYCDILSIIVSANLKLVSVSYGYMLLLMTLYYFFSVAKFGVYLQYTFAYNASCLHVYLLTVGPTSTWCHQQYISMHYPLQTGKQRLWAWIRMFTGTCSVPAHFSCEICSLFNRFTHVKSLSQWRWTRQPKIDTSCPV